jgi:hypothetical protein
MSERQHFANGGSDKETIKQTTSQITVATTKLSDLRYSADSRWDQPDLGAS